LKSQFRQNIIDLWNTARSVAALEQDEETRQTHVRNLHVFLYALLVVSVIFWIIPFRNGIRIELVIVVAETAVLAISLLVLRLTGSHLVTCFALVIMYLTVISVYMMTNQWHGIGINYHWLWILLIPMGGYAFTGAIYGLLLSLLGMLQMIVFMWPPLKHFLYLDGMPVLITLPLIYISFAILFFLIQWANSRNHLWMKEKRSELDEQRQQYVRYMRQELAVYQKNDEILRQAKHDSRHHMAVIRSLLEENDIEGVKRYLEDLDKSLASATRVRYCSNQIVNAILSIYSSRADEMGTKSVLRAEVPEKIGVADLDLASLIGNIMENVTEAQMQVHSTDRAVRASFVGRDDRLLILVENTTDEVVTFEKNGLPVSTRAREGGVSENTGTQSIRRSAEKYGGFAGFSQKNKYFTTKVILNCGERSEQ